MTPADPRLVDADPEIIGGRYCFASETFASSSHRRRAIQTSSMGHLEAHVASAQV